MYNAKIQHGNVQAQSICFSESNFQNLDIDFANSLTVPQIVSNLSHVNDIDKNKS